MLEKNLHGRSQVTINESCMNWSLIIFISNAHHNFFFFFFFFLYKKKRKVLPLRDLLYNYAAEKRKGQSMLLITTGNRGRRIMLSSAEKPELPQSLSSSLEKVRI